MPPLPEIPDPKQRFTGALADLKRLSNDKWVEGLELEVVIQNLRRALKDLGVLGGSHD